MDEIQVDFDFCSMQESDYFGLLFLIKQIFGEDAKELGFLRLLVQVVLESNGTVVKVDESDPYALMTIIDFDQDVKTYFNKSDQLSKYLDKSCWLVSDRLINMPPQLVPNLMRLVLDDIQIQKEFVVYFCKMGRYVESPLELEESNNRPGKKRRIETSSQEFYFQPEDEVFQKYAIEKFDFEFDKQSMSSDAKRTFQDQGIVPFRRILILKSNLLSDIQTELVKFLQ